MSTTPVDQLLTSAEVAALAGKDRSRVSIWVTCGKLTPVRQLPGRNGAMLFDPVDVRRFLGTDDTPDAA